MPPIGFVAVVDPIRHAQAPDTLELFGAGGGADHPCARHVGELRGEHRHAPGAQHQDRLACLQRPAAVQRVPRREPGAGQRRRFLVGQVWWDVDEVLLVHQHLLGQHAVHAAAQGAGPRFRHHVAAEPALHEGRAHPVPELDPAHVRAHRGHLAGAVRQRDEVGHSAARAVAAGRHHQVPVVQRPGAHPELHLATLRLGRGRLRQGQVIDALGFRQAIEAHEGLRPLTRSK